MSELKHIKNDHIAGQTNQPNDNNLPSLFKKHQTDNRADKNVLYGNINGNKTFNNSILKKPTFENSSKDDRPHIKKKTQKDLKNDLIDKNYHIIDSVLDYIKNKNFLDKEHYNKLFDLIQLHINIQTTIIRGESPTYNLLMEVLKKQTTPLEDELNWINNDYSEIEIMPESTEENVTNKENAYLKRQKGKLINGERACLNSLRLIRSQEKMMDKYRYNAGVIYNLTPITFEESQQTKELYDEKQLDYSNTFYRLEHIEGDYLTSINHKISTKRWEAFVAERTKMKPKGKITKSNDPKKKVSFKEMT